MIKFQWILDKGDKISVYKEGNELGGITINKIRYPIKERWFVKDYRGKDRIRDTKGGSFNIKGNKKNDRTYKKKFNKLRDDMKKKNSYFNYKEKLI